MKIEIEVAFNIGNKVRVKKPHSGAYFKPEPFEAVVLGYVVNKTSKQTRVYYTVTPASTPYNASVATAVLSYGKRKKYMASELEKID